MRTNRKRVAVPFLFRAADGLGANGKLIARAYGSEVEGVFTRAGKKAVSADVGALTVAHSGLCAAAASEFEHAHAIWRSVRSSSDSNKSG